MSTCDSPKTSPDLSPGLRAAQEGLQEPQEGLEGLIFDEISMIWVQAGYFGSEKTWAGYLGSGNPWAGYLGRGKTLGGLFGPRKNPGRVIWAAEKLRWPLFWLRINHAHTHTFWKFEIQTPYFCCIEDPQRSSFVRPEYPSGLDLGPGMGRARNLATSLVEVQRKQVGSWG